jgi:hypothetical protein
MSLYKPAKAEIANYSTQKRPILKYFYFLCMVTANLGLLM